jgi:hypothetical protein
VEQSDSELEDNRKGKKPIRAPSQVTRAKIPQKLAKSPKIASSPQESTRRVSARTNKGKPKQWWLVEKSMCAFTAIEIPVDIMDVPPTSDSQLPADGIIEPLTYAEAMASPQRQQWSQAMKDEIASLLRNGTYQLTTLPPGRHAIGSKWVFKLKRDANGNIFKFKARLVIQGFAQKKGKDFHETFAPVARMTSNRLVVAIAALEDLQLYSIDVDNAYLNGQMDTQMFMKQPQGFIDPQHPSKVCELLKSLYGLKQAGNIWNATIHNYLIELGFKRSPSDLCVYTKNMEGRIVAALHVDDFLLAATPSQYKHFVDALTAKFPSKFQPTSQCLGMRVLKTPNGYTLDQQSYLERVIDRFGMKDVKPVSTPMTKADIETLVCGKSGGRPLTQEEHSVFRQIVGKLMYAMVGTRPDIAYSLSVLGRYAAAPDSFHLAMAKRVLAYIKGTLPLKLHFSSRGSNGATPQLVGYVDSDYANDPSRKSTTGFCFFLSGNPLSWCSKKQTTIATSTTVAEYFALYEATIELVSLRNQLQDVGLSQLGPTVLHEDNQTAIRLAEDETAHKRTKHIDVKYRYTKEQQDLKTLTVQYIPSESNLADFFTKPLARVQFQDVCKQLGLSL